MRPGTSPYTLIRRLGSGGMAEVFLARDTSRGGRLVALKRMRGSTPELRVHFTREARVGARLTHPNVVGVEDSGLDEDGPFIALEFVDGVSASTLMRFYAQQRTVLPLEVWCVLARDMAAGLHYAHSAPMPGGARGVLHRDLSTDNVLVSREGVAKLSDFGLAYTAGDTHVTRTGTVKGKVAYLAPELFEGGAHSTSSDVYALGVVLFRLATGMLPFRGNNDGELILNILHSERPLLSALRPDLPGPLVAWTQQALCQRAEERPRLEALLELLPAYEEGRAARAVLAQAVVAAGESSASEPASPWAGEEHTQRVEPALAEPPGGSAEEATERRPRVGPEPRETDEEATERRPRVGAEPWREGDESTERLPRVRPEPPAGDDPTERQLPAVLRPVSSAGAPMPPSPVGRSGRTAVWLLVGALALGLLGALAVSAW